MEETMDERNRDVRVLFDRFKAAFIDYRDRVAQLEKDNADLITENRELRDQLDYWRGKGMGVN